MASVTLAYYPVLIIVSAVLYMIFTVITHQFQNVLQLFLEMYPGIISERTVSTANFAATCLIYSPAVVLIAIAIWSIVRNVGGHNY